MDIQELKKRACEAVDRNAEKIIAVGESIFHEPELGFKEFKTAEKVKKIFDELGYEHQDGVAITGVIAPLKGKESKIRLALMGELDAIVAPGHRCADPVTGAAHSCGHHVQIATLMGAAMALKDSGIMQELSGDIVLMAVPAEEGVELGYRHGLMEQGKLSFIGGKQEFIKLGVFDDIDMMLMQHTDTSDKVAAGGGVGMGYVAKIIHYIGKEAHAGGEPHKGINALNAAKIGLMAIDAQRETFQDKDMVRVHPIITKGGDLVNVVPADVRIETFCRANNMPAVLDASMKVDRALKAGADAVGAKVNIYNLPGYMHPYEAPEMKAIVEENLAEVYGADKVVPGVGYTTEANDVAHLIPVVHCTIGGAAGVPHSQNYEIENKDMAYIKATKMLLCSAIDLLANGAEKGLSVKRNFHAPMTKEQYLKEWGHLEV